MDGQEDMAPQIREALLYIVVGRAMGAESH